MVDRDPKVGPADQAAEFNKRAGHIAVSHKGRALVWGGYQENQVESDQYWSSGEIWLYNSLTQAWRRERTTGDIPSKCSGAAAAVLEDTMYVVAGFHKIVVSLRSLQSGIEDSDESEDSEEEEEEGMVRMVGSVEISNTIWSLDLLSLRWTRLQPAGEPPLRCDKTGSWAYDDKIYIFGGFGPPPSSGQQEKLGTLFQFCEDPSTARGGVASYPRGWSNQLVCFNTLTNRWEWPVTSGPAPSPRAAHSTVVIGSTAYVFGGRHLNTRLNDLYSLDLVSLHWSLLLADSAAENTPAGRSWQTVTAIETGRPEGGLLLYGGFDNNLEALGDCWRMDLAVEPVSWVRCPHLEGGPRLWHAAARVDPSQVIVIGGLTNNILASRFVEKHHAEEVLYLRVAPPSLLKLCLEFVTKHNKVFKKEVDDLPLSLKKIVKLRCSSNSGA